MFLVNRKACFTAIALLSMGATVFAGDTDMTGAQLSKPDKDIVQIATGDNMAQVTTLVKLVKAADLVSTLQGEGPFTVFAPTNQAFEALEKAKPGTLEMLMKPENKEKLRAVLLYHVVPAKKMAADVTTMTAPTADGDKTIKVVKSDEGVVLNGDAKVIKADIVAKNGVIHWIDHVLLPPAN